MSKFYDCLVITSGAVKGFSILGALDYLESTNSLKWINIFGGCSVGAAISYLIMIGYTPKEILTYTSQNDLLQLFSAINLLTLPEHFGVIDSNLLLHYLEEMTMLKLGYIPTFSDVSKMSNKFFMCPSYNLSSTESSVYFSVLTHPDMPIVKAVSLSCNIPLLFSRAKWNNDYYIDGAYFDVFPIKKLIQLTNPKSVIGITFDHEDSKDMKIESLVDYLKSIISIKNHDNRRGKFIQDYKEFLETRKDVKCDIVKLKCEVNGLDFSLSVKERLDMYLKGKEYMKKYFIN